MPGGGLAEIIAMKIPCHCRNMWAIMNTKSDVLMEKTVPLSGKAGGFNLYATDFNKISILHF